MQTVKVKVISVGDNGKISLSIKKAMDNQSKNEKNDRFEKRDRRDFNGNHNNKQYRGGKKFDGKNRDSATSVTSPGNFEWQSSRRNENASFEDLMSKFKQTSEEKFSALKRGSENSARRPRRNQKS